MASGDLYYHISMNLAAVSCSPMGYLLGGVGMGMIVGYQLEKIRRRRYKPKLNKNDQYTRQCWENKSRFHYLWLEVLPTPTFRNMNAIPMKLCRLMD